MTAADALVDAFEENLRSRGEVGASVSVWAGGEEVVTLAGGGAEKRGGEAWGPDTLVPVFSATKGPAAATFLHALHRAGLSPSDRLGTVWPEFAAGGKSGVTFADLLAHRAGMAALDRDVSIGDHPAAVAALETQAPGWELGDGHGYHPRTFGFLLEELVRRLAGGRRLGSYWREVVAGPLGLDVWIGLPPAEDPRVARVYPAPAATPLPEEPFWAAMAEAGSLTRRAFDSPPGLASVSAFNRPETWRLGLPAMGGIASARGLAKFYGCLASGGGGVFAPEVLRWMEAEVSEGPDRVLRVPTAFSAGFMKDPRGPDGTKIREHFGPSTRAFGHPGAGGSLAFADPENGLGFAYTMNQLGRSPLPGERALSLVDAVYGEGGLAARRTR